MQTPIRKLTAAPPMIRNLTLDLLDEISRPLTARELDRAFMHVGFTRSEARRFVKALKRCQVIAVVQE